MYNLNNTGQTGGTPDADIDAPEAWDLVTGSNNVAIGDIDTGIDYNHVDLAAHAKPNPAECNGTPGVDDDGNGYIDDCHGIDTINHDSNPMDDAGHGTHTAGTIGAVGNNGVGVVGVNWNVTIVACKSHASDRERHGRLDHRVHAVHGDRESARTQRSSPPTTPTAVVTRPAGYDPATYDAIKSNMTKGILFVASAGNDSSRQRHQSEISHELLHTERDRVAATDHNDNKASFSNYGDRTVLVGAPGVNVKSTFPNNAYANLSGTSMAAPHVHGPGRPAGSPGPEAAPGRDPEPHRHRWVTRRLRWTARPSPAAASTPSARRHVPPARRSSASSSARPRRPGSDSDRRAQGEVREAGGKKPMKVTITPGGATVNPRR